MNSKWKDLLESRRFWAAIGGVVVVIGQDVFGFEADTVQQVVNLAIAFIVGDSLRKIRKTESRTLKIRVQRRKCRPTSTV